MVVAAEIIILWALIGVQGFFLISPSWNYKAGFVSVGVNSLHHSDLLLYSKRSASKLNQKVYDILDSIE